MFGENKEITKYLKYLEKHLQDENPLLVEAVQNYRHLDRLVRRTGLLAADQSYAMKISWWPLISILGTFSAGKSTFINQYLGQKLQATGNQAVDDKFSVLCYSSEAESRILPGVALDADPRFPFYQIRDELEKVASGEGGRVDAYLQLKTSNSDQLRGSILIDSPGFDADSQRTAILKITSYIIDLSDLVLVFFDARHPEPGAMQDTLTHLVSNTIQRNDSSKFLYILNQIDTTAKEDNPEDIVGSWQRAMAQEGLTAGKFYAIYNKDVANPIEDPALHERYERKCEADLQDITRRMAEVRVERAYRIIDMLVKNAHQLEDVQIPRLRQVLSRWQRGALIIDGVIWLLLLGILLGITVSAGHWDGIHYVGPWWDWLKEQPYRLVTAGVAVFILALVINSFARRWSASFTRRYIGRLSLSEEEREDLLRAFRKNTRWWHSIFRPDPVGWSKRAKRKLHGIMAAADLHIQSLNDRFTSPSGGTDDLLPGARTENHEHEQPVASTEDATVTTASTDEVPAEAEKKPEAETDKT